MGDAVHARGRHEPGDGRGCARPADGEALGLIAYTQMVRAGAPGDVRRLHLERRYEIGSARLRHSRICVKATLAGGQIARHFKLPYRSSK